MAPNDISIFNLACIAVSAFRPGKTRSHRRKPAATSSWLARCIAKPSTRSAKGRKDPVLLNKIGIAYHQMMQLDNARKSYEQALKLKPNYVEAINNLGTVYYARKSFRRAISLYNKALKVAPRSRNPPRST